MVDDDREIVNVIVEPLNDAGYQARWATNGVKAVRAVADQRLALLLLDVRLPVMDCVEASQAIRQHHPTLPIVLVTATPSDGRDLIAARQADDLVTKPFSLDLLLDTLEQLMPA